MKNIQGVLKQLKHNTIAVTCDEGVYHITKEIQMNRPNEFSNIVLCLGSFHMIKIVLCCIGKYIEGSGAENIFTENCIFGENVVKSVITGSHYVRSLSGMIILGEAMERMQWKEFLTYDSNLNKHSNSLTSICKMKDSFALDEQGKAKEHLKSFTESSKQLLEDFKKFKAKMGKKSEICTFWNNFVSIISLLHNIVLGRQRR